MWPALILVVAVILVEWEVVMVTAYVIHGKVLTIVMTVDVIIIIFVNHSVGKQNLHVGQTVDATPTQCVNLAEEKPLATARTVQVTAEVGAIQEVLLQLVDIILAQVGQWDPMVVNILHQVVALQKVQDGLEQNAHVNIQNKTLEAIVESQMTKIV